MEEQLRALVDAEWEARLGVDRSVLRGSGVHVVVAGLGANDAMSFLLDEVCVVVVPADEVDSARAALAGLGARPAFTEDALRRLVGSDAQVDGPSWHSYVNERSFLGMSDSAAVPVDGGDISLIAFLEDNDPADWAESGFPRDPSSADPRTNRFWVLREHGQIVAAGNMTEWRGFPADVGVLTSPAERTRGLAGRLVGARDDLPLIAGSWTLHTRRYVVSRVRAGARTERVLCGGPQSVAERYGFRARWEPLSCGAPWSQRRPIATMY